MKNIENQTNESASFFTKKTLFKILFSFLVSIVLFSFILKYISFPDIIIRIQQTSLLVIIVSCLFLLTNYFFRTLRSHLLLSGKIHFFQLYIITILHNTLVQLLPFRLGEFSFLYLTTKTKKVTVIDAGATLVSLHLFDVVIIISAFFISFLSLEDTIALPIPKTFLLILFGVILLLVISLLFAQKTQRFLAAYLSKRQGKNTFWILLLTKITPLLTFLHTFRSKKKLFLLLFYSFCVWTSYYALMYFLYFSSGLTFTYMTFLFILSTALLFALVPIQGIAGFGNVEISWSALIILLGVESTHALQTTVHVHIIGIIATLILGALGLLIFLLYKKSKSNLRQESKFL